MRDQLLQLLPNSLILPRRISIHPRNNITLQYENFTKLDSLGQILKKLSSENRKLNISDTLHIIKELLIICLVLHRHSFSIAGLSFDQVYVVGSSVLLSLIGDSDTFVKYFSSQDKMKIAHFSDLILINQLYQHTDANRILEIQNFISFVEQLVALSQMASPEYASQFQLWERIIYSNKVLSLSNLLAMILFYEKIIGNQQLLQKANDISSFVYQQNFNPFYMFNKYLGFTISQFVLNQEFLSLLCDVLLGDSPKLEDIQHNKIILDQQNNMFCQEYLYDNYILNEKVSLLGLNKVKIKDVEGKLYIINQDKYHHRSFINVISLLSHYVYGNYFICFKLRLIDDFISQIISLVYSIKSDISNMRSIIQDSVLSKHYSKDQIDAIQYLGQLYPQLFDCFDVLPNTELQQFECLMGGLYILKLARLVIKHEVKIILLVDENDIVLGQTEDIDRNIIYSILINMNEISSLNISFVFLQNSQKPKTKEQAILRYKFARFIERSVLKKETISFSNPLLPNCLENMWSFITGRSPNAAEIRFVSDSVKGFQCQSKNCVCQFSLIKKFLLSSGLFYIDINQEMLQKTSLSLMPQEIQSIYVDIIHQVSNQMSFSIDYWYFANSCPQKTDMFLSILSVYRASSVKSLHLRSILFSLALFTKKVGIQVLSKICDMSEEEVIAICEQLVKYKLVTKFENNIFMISTIEICIVIIKDIKYDDLAIVSKNIFEFLLETYELHHTFDLMFDKQQNEWEVKSQLWRLFRAFDISDKLSGKVQPLRIQIQQRQQLLQNVVLITEPSCSAIMSIDQVLSQSNELIFQESQSEDFDFDHFDIQSKKQSELEYALQRDLMKIELQNIQSLFMRIKTCIMLIATLSPNGVVDNIQKPCILLEHQSIQISNYSTFINYIVQRTHSLLQSIKNITNKNFQFSFYNEVTSQLELSCYWYQFVYTPNGVNSQILNKLCQAKLNTTGIVLIGWRLIRAGYIQEAINLMMRQLSQIVDFQVMVDHQTKIYQIEMNYQDYMQSVFYDFLEICGRYHRLLTKQIQCDSTISQIIPITLIVEIIFTASRLNGNTGLLLSLAIQLLLIAEKHGTFLIANICCLIVVNWVLTQMYKLQLDYQSIYQQYYNIFNRIFNDFIIAMTDQKFSLLRSTNIISITSKQQYSEVMLDITYKQDYEILQKAVFNTLSFSMLSELYLMMTLLNIQGQQTLINMIFELDQDIVQSTVFDSSMLFRAICFEIMFNTMITNNNFELYAQLRLNIDFAVRVSENQDEAQYFCLIANFIDAMTPNQIQTKAKYPYSIKNINQKYHMNSILLTKFESLYNGFLQNKIIFGAILAIGFHLPYLFLVNPDSKEFYFILEQTIQMKNSFVNTFLEEQYKIFQYPFLLQSKQQFQCNQLTYKLLFSLRWTKQKNYDYYRQIILSDECIYHEIYGNETTVFKALSDEKDDIVINTKMVKQRKISKTENQYGFIYFWSE